MTMTNHTCTATAAPSSRNMGAPSSSFDINRNTGLASALPIHPRLRSATPSAIPDKELEHRHWARVMAQDHALLRLLGERFERAEQPREQIMLLRLALDFEEMHAVFESGWVQIPSLGPARFALDGLAEQIERTAPGSGLYRARGLYWNKHLIDLMRREEVCHREKLPRCGPFSPWPGDLLEWRMRLSSEMRAVLKVESATGNAHRA